METFAEARKFVNHPSFEHDRRSVLSGLSLKKIDAPIRDIIKTMGKMSYCFTLQCCYGHFVWDEELDPHNLAILPLKYQGQFRYRIAYLAFCVEKSAKGTSLRDRLAALRDIDKEYVQFGSPCWFWQQYPNTYALQVEPRRFALKDEALLGHAEALHVQSVRDIFYQRVRELVVDLIVK